MKKLILLLLLLLIAALVVWYQRPVARQRPAHVVRQVAYQRGPEGQPVATGSRVSAAAPTLSGGDAVLPARSYPAGMVPLEKLFETHPALADTFGRVFGSGYAYDSVACAAEVTPQRGEGYSSDIEFAETFEVNAQGVLQLQHAELLTIHNEPPPEIVDYAECILKKRLARGPALPQASGERPLTTVTIVNGISVWGNGAPPSVEALQTRVAELRQSLKRSDLHMREFFEVQLAYAECMLGHKADAAFRTQCLREAAALEFASSREDAALPQI